MVSAAIQSGVLVFAERSIGGIPTTTSAYTRPTSVANARGCRHRHLQPLTRLEIAANESSEWVNPSKTRPSAAKTRPSYLLILPQYRTKRRKLELLLV